ncbi:hypothetical protein PPL_08278 [Heterostelium album PN500]|uniref:Uncharacterized protein n=1 Tax=Heterostelium pallidum (strain ATCC 26659 / Pp 5 / PN500) TaxID=670386 RepID=D3BHR4_HETP5|nr:hypothetical protein PPL_08278 [Heterostelium album PN500]EFA78814.1 hypothetical protein PPL_08278 [Heterostelium album PN500]|eukprot:XP_020430938.1 hypothetical protein PPL_08278 [Heterostelium album PN500]
MKDTSNSIDSNNNSKDDNNINSIDNNDNNKNIDKNNKNENEMNIDLKTESSSNNSNNSNDDDSNNNNNNKNQNKQQTTVSSTTPVLNTTSLTSSQLINSSSSIGNTPSLHGGSGVLFILKDSEIVRLFSQVPKETIVNCIKSVSQMYHLTIDETIEKVPKLKLLHVVNECIGFTGIDDFTGCLQPSIYPALLSLLGSPEVLVNHAFLRVDPAAADEHRLSFYQLLSSHIKRRGINWLLDNSDDSMKLQYCQSLKLDYTEPATTATTTTTTTTNTTTTATATTITISNKIKDEIIMRGTESFLKNVKAPVVRAVAEGLKINKVGSKELIIDKILETIFNFRQLNSAEKEDSDDGSPLELSIISLSPHSTPETMIEDQEEESTPSPPPTTTAPVTPVTPSTPSSSSSTTTTNTTTTSTPNRRASTAAAIAAANNFTGTTKVKIPLKNFSTTITTAAAAAAAAASSSSSSSSSATSTTSSPIKLTKYQQQQQKLQQQQQQQQQQEKQQKQQSIKEKKIVEEDARPELNAFGRVKRKQKLNMKYFNSDDEQVNVEHEEKPVLPSRTAMKEMTPSKKSTPVVESSSDEEENVDAEESDDENSDNDEKSSDNSDNEEESGAENNEDQEDSDDEESDEGVEQQAKPKRKRKPTESTMNPLSLIVKGISREQLHTLFHAPDLKAYCKLNSLRSTGSKRDIMRRILLFLKRGTNTNKQKNKVVPSPTPSSASDGTTTTTTTQTTTTPQKSRREKKKKRRRAY